MDVLVSVGGGGGVKTGGGLKWDFTVFLCIGHIGQPNLCFL